jgi:DsbC/DsbD-like thiol-disulfide interchange protein
MPLQALNHWVPQVLSTGINRTEQDPGMFAAIQRPLAVVVTMAMTICFAGQSAVAQRKDLVLTKLITDVASVKPGDTFTVAVHFAISPGWHIYWSNPGDSGAPTEIEWKLPDGFEVSDLQFPLPVRFDQPGKILGYGYKDEVVLFAAVKAPAKIDASEIEIGAEAIWLVCKDTCIPGESEMTITLPVKSEVPAASHDAALIARFKSEVPAATPEAAGLQAKIESRARDGVISVKIRWDQQPPTQYRVFPPLVEHVEFGAFQLQQNDKTTEFTLSYSVMAGQNLPKTKTSIVLAYSFGNEMPRGLEIPIEFPGRVKD